MTECCGLWLWQHSNDGRAGQPGRSFDFLEYLKDSLLIPMKHFQAIRYQWVFQYARWKTVESAEVQS